MEIKQSDEFYYRVTADDNLSLICSKFNTSEQNIIRNNKDLKLYAGEWIIIKQNEYIAHIVKPAETLEVIANKYNVGMQKLIDDNNLTSQKLFIGQTIKVYK